MVSRIKKFMKIQRKKGQVLGGIGVLPKVAILFVVIAVVFGVGFEFLNDQKADMTADSNAYNATNKIEEGLTKVSNKFPTIGLAIAAGVVIAIVAGLLLGKNF